MSEITNPKRNPVKVGYLVTGLVFLGLAGSWALSANGAIDGATASWLLPSILVGAGVIGLVAMLASGVRRSRPGPDTHDRDGFAVQEPDDTAGLDHPNDPSTIPEEDHR
jgi:hypothetical protein